MRDVARQADVSVMTVSRVVNDTPNVDVTTRQRVRVAIEQLGYRPNAAASSLRRQNASVGAIGLVVDDVANPFCSALSAGVERICQKRHTLLLSGSSGFDADTERELISAFLSHRVDGLVVMSSDVDHGYLEPEMRRGVQVVFVDRTPDEAFADTVTSDNAGLGRVATEHLISYGHRRVAFLGPRQEADTTRLRHAGYLAALAGAGLAREPELEVLDLDDASAAELALGELLDSALRPTAVVTAQNLVTRGSLKALHDRGLQFEVALVGVDDLELAALLDPPVTVLAQDPDEIGAQAATLLFDRLGGHVEPPRRHIVPARLMIRGSGELPPG